MAMKLAVERKPQELEEKGNGRTNIIAGGLQILGHGQLLVRVLAKPISDQSTTLKAH